MKKTALLLISAFFAVPTPGAAETLARTYSYFSIGGSSVEEIERELTRRGPMLGSTGRRHPGATQMKFSTRVTYASTERWCGVDNAVVSVDAKIILPRWGNRRRADGDTALIWDTLAADIKRHEEQHAIIAKRHARELEDAIKALDRSRDCATLKVRAEKLSERILKKHDDAQERFDRIETKGFEKRLLRLLAYRLERKAASE